LETYSITNPYLGFAKMPIAEAVFLEKWRGVARLAVVDVPEELTIEVPPFDPGEFFYIDENGNEVCVNGSVRIDMIFLYSKPIDAASTKVWQNGQKVSITTPQLGLIRGGGIGVNFTELANLKTDYTRDANMYDADGNVQILPNAADADQDTIGFTNDVNGIVKGSFPAPDDILNLAPLLSEELESTADELVGQSILPLAYVMTEAVGDTSIAGAAIIPAANVVDIRPFFRTAELAYNERIGIAAAIPQLSIVNPAVGKAQLDLTTKKLIDYIDSKLVTDFRKSGIAATGYIMGGLNYGVEGALYDYYIHDGGLSGKSKEEIMNAIITGNGYAHGTLVNSIPDYPDWDLAEWCKLQNIPNKGWYKNDYMNCALNCDGPKGEIPGNPDPQGYLYDNKIGGKGQFFNYGSYKNSVGPAGEILSSPTGSLKRMSEWGANFAGDEKQQYNTLFCKKRIYFNRDAYPWMADFYIQAQFLNCIPLNYSPKEYVGRSTGIWIEKGYDWFTVYVGFCANDQFYDQETGQIENLPRVPAVYQTEEKDKNSGKKVTIEINGRATRRFTGIIVMNEDFITASKGLLYVGSPSIGLCTYPTVTWQMYAISHENSNIISIGAKMQQTDPVISISTD